MNVTPGMMVLNALAIGLRSDIAEPALRQGSAVSAEPRAAGTGIA